MDHHPPVDFISGVTTLQWTLLAPDQVASAIAEIEPTFPVHTGLFMEIVELLKSAEVWTREDREICFTWFVGELRQSLHFLSFTPEDRWDGIETIYTTETQGEILSCFTAMVNSLWCHPALGDFPARLVLFEDLPVKETATAVLLVTCRRGKGNDTGYSFRAHTTWVG